MKLLGFKLKNVWKNTIFLFLNFYFVVFICLKFVVFVSSEYPKAGIKYWGINSIYIFIELSSKMRFVLGKGKGINLGKK